MEADGTRRPIVTIPRETSYATGAASTKKGKGQGGKSDDDNNNHNDGSSSSFSCYPVYLTEDWDSGIGGGLWTTGLALGRYFATSPHFLQEYRRLRASRDRKETNHNSYGRYKSETADGAAVDQGRPQAKPVRVLELGSGNGFLGVCLVASVAVAEANDTTTAVAAGWPGIEVVVTDTAEHLSLMKETIDSNLKRILPQILRDRAGGEQLANELAIERIAQVEEYLWGEKYDFGAGGNTDGQKQQPFDLIVGSDVAYRDHLHDPLIDALDEFCVPNHTVALIGVTMNDTKPIFFEKVFRRGFSYEKLADHLLGEEFCTSARQFGVFAITKR